MPLSSSDALETVRQEYRASLADLTFNSKPIITSLTIIALEHAHAAQAIAQTILDQISNAQPGKKLPFLYLLDSIIKNDKGTYRAVFAKKIVPAFTAAYNAVPDKDKRLLHKLVNTWKTYQSGPVFPANVIAEIDRVLQASPGPTVPPSTSSSASPSPALPSTKPSLKRATVLSASTLSASSKSPALPSLASRSVTPTLVTTNHSLSKPASGRPSPTYPQIDAASIASASSLQQLQSTLSSMGPASATSLSLALDVNGAATIGVQQQIYTLLQQKQAQLLINPTDLDAQKHILILNQLLEVVMTTSLDPATIAQISAQIQGMLSVSPSSVLASPDVSLDGVNVSAAAIAPSLGSGIVSGFPTAPVSSGVSFGYSGLAPVLSMHQQQLQSTQQQQMQMPAFLHTQSHQQQHLMLPAGIDAVGMSSYRMPSSMDMMTDMSYGASGGPLLSMGPTPQSGTPGLSRPTSTTPGHGDAAYTHVRQLPTIRLVHEDIHRSYPRAIDLLYTAMPLQCKQCGLRFIINVDDTVSPSVVSRQVGSATSTHADDGETRMAAHMDWHFRQNRRQRERARKTISRGWYLPEVDWIAEVEGTVSDAQVVPVFSSGGGGGIGSRGGSTDSRKAGGSGLTTTATGLGIATPVSTISHGKTATTSTSTSISHTGIPSSTSASVSSSSASTSAAATRLPVSNIPAEGEKSARCAICCEPLEKFYDDEADEWMLRGAVKRDDEFYHQSCIEGVKVVPKRSTPTVGTKRKLEPTTDTVTTTTGHTTISNDDDKKPRVGVSPVIVDGGNGVGSVSVKRE